MKRTWIVAGLALASIALTQQQASAWRKFTFSTGLNITAENNGGTFSFLGFSKTTPPPPGIAAVPMPAPYYPGVAVPGVAVPGAPPVPPPTPANNGPTTQTSFFNPTAYPFPDPQYANYGDPAAAPSYWYGK